MISCWHGSVGWTLTSGDGTYCDYIGRAYQCDSLDDGWRKAIDWLREHPPSKSWSFLTHTFTLDVKFC